MTRSRVLALAIAMAASVSIQAQAPQYRARLSVVPLDVPQQATIAGVSTPTAVLKGSTLTVNGSFSGLKTPATVVASSQFARPGCAAYRLAISLRRQKQHGTFTGYDRTHQAADR